MQNERFYHIFGVQVIVLARNLNDIAFQSNSENHLKFGNHSANFSTIDEKKIIFSKITGFAVEISRALFSS